MQKYYTASATAYVFLTDLDNRWRMCRQIGPINSYAGVQVHQRPYSLTRSKTCTIETQIQT